MKRFIISTADKDLSVGISANSKKQAIQLVTFYIKGALDFRQEIKHGIVLKSEDAENQMRDELARDFGAVELDF